jgi:hypothetical protein
MIIVIEPSFSDQGTKGIKGDQGIVGPIGFKGITGDR